MKRMAVFGVLAFFLIVTVALGQRLWLMRAGREVAVAKPGVRLIEAETGRTEKVHSGDGKVALVKTGPVSADGAATYSFKIIDRVDNTERNILVRPVAAGTLVSIPYNSWSPDNKQFYIEEKNEDGVRYQVFRADGEKYGDLDFLEVSDFWLKSGQKFRLSLITGWAGNDLLEVRTKREDGTAGPAFWFVISSKSFLRLRG